MHIRFVTPMTPAQVADFIALLPEELREQPNLHESELDFPMDLLPYLGEFYKSAGLQFEIVSDEQDPVDVLVAKMLLIEPDGKILLPYIGEEGIVNILGAYTMAQEFTIVDQAIRIGLVDPTTRTIEIFRG